MIHAAKSRMRRHLRGLFRATALPLLAGGLALGAPRQEAGAPGLIYYEKARPIVDLGKEDLLPAYPELAGVQFEEDQDSLETLLARTGASLEAFFRYFPNTISKEKVRQERLRPDGHVDAHLDQESYYLVVARTGRETSGFDESRTDAKGKPVQRKRLRGQSFLTSGFAGAGIFFLPVNQKDFRFRILGRDPARANAYVLAFSARHDSSLQGKFEMEKDEAMLLSQGLAWIHPDSYRLLSMTTGLMGIFAAQPVVLALKTKIWFDIVNFPSATLAFSLPAQVEVSIRWREGNYRNVHRYSDYRMFSVETHESRMPLVKP
jgi:hypothetical protein